ncbi:MAG: CrcB family protein [Acidimicrobiia bacterium]|nr:CrcB family protein [Acidimicrobiia bacterium]
MGDARSQRDRPLVIGLVVGLGMYHGLGTGARSVVGTGFLGGYTTFSTFAVETVRLWEDRSHRLAASYAAASFVLGLAAAASGLALAAAL